jgi:predicted amidophosphoribosyltransferase
LSTSGNLSTFGDGSLAGARQSIRLICMWSTLTDLALPRTCPGCGTGEPWCGACAGLLAGRPRRARLSPNDRAEAPLPPAYALAPYRGPVRAAILAAKEHGRRDLPARLGQALGAGLARLIAIAVILLPFWLVPAPTRPAVARSRGGDPITWMARSAAIELARRGYPAGVAPCLFTARGARDSVGLDASARMDNLRGRVRWRSRAAPPPGMPVILIDDVLTTGATASCSTEVLTAHDHPVQLLLTLATVPTLAPVGHRNHGQ